MSRLRSAVVPALVLGALSASHAAGAGTELPTRVLGNDVISTSIDPAGDVDEYELTLLPGDVLTAKVRDDGAVRGLQSTLSLTAPTGSPAATVTGNGTTQATLTFTATRDGPHVLRLVGKPGEFTGSVGGYLLTFTVKHVKPPKATYADAAGGAIVHRFGATEGSTLVLKATTKRGGFDLTELRRPDGSPEPGFAAALKAAKNRRSAAVKKLPLTGGTGLYELVGAYDAGSSVTVAATVKHGDPKRRRSLLAEPRFDLAFLPFPDRGIVGTELHVPGSNFTYVDVPDRPGRRGKPPVIGVDVYPRIWVGAFEVPRATMTRPAGDMYVFPVPAGPVARQSYDVTVENADGQRVVLEDAFTVLPPPTLTSIAAIDGGVLAAGPEGGRRLRITGADLRSGTLVYFGTTPALPSVVLPTRIDVVAPRHAPENVVVSVRDEDGQTAALPGTFPYLDVPSNRISSTDRTFLQALGGEVVTVTGTDLGDDTKLTFDGQDVGAVRLSPTQMRFTAPPRADGTAALRVVDALEQSSSISVPVRGLQDRTGTNVPAPRTDTFSVDGWRGVRVLVGEVTGDGRNDLVLLQSAQALGQTIDRSRVRVLAGASDGTFSDATASWIPQVSGDEDWRARDGVLVDLDGDGDLDLALVTDDPVEDGERSSLRLLRNDGSSTGFTDRTSSWAPSSTSYGDVNQGVAIAALGRDLVIAHTASFRETIVTVTDPGDPTAIPPIPPTSTSETFYYAALRVLRNDGSGRLTRDGTAVPAVTDAGVQQYQADAIAVGDVVGDGSLDVVLTRSAPPESPAATWHRALRVLRGSSGGAFTDVSDDVLPAASDPEYLQGLRVVIADVDADHDRDLLVLGGSPLASPDGSGGNGLALRLLRNGGTTFSLAASGTLPDLGTADRLQGADVLVGDLDGAEGPEIVVLATSPPVAGERACRILRSSGSAWVDASAAFPSPVDDDGRGSGGALVDLQADGDLDLVVIRNDADETVRNTRVFFNQRR